MKVEILVALRRHPNGMTSTEIGNAVGVSSVKIFRDLSILIDCGLVKKMRDTESNKNIYFYPCSPRG